ncbi:MAG: hypothetical protein KI792_14405 [Alphaproteobacteria bacterium]|nr:hypothetical protein [Alphaproteobacteria bacterium SS10]
MSLFDLADQLHGPSALNPATPEWADAVDRFLAALVQQPLTDEASFGRVEQVLVFCLAQQNADLDQVGNFALSLLFNTGIVGLIDQAMATDPTGRSLWFLANPTLRRLVSSPLLTSLLTLRPITNSHGERLLTALRQGLLLDWTGARVLGDEHWGLLLPILNAMAVHGAMTEYAWMIEDGAMDALVPAIKSLASPPSAEMLPTLMLAACYGPLTDWPETKAMALNHEAALLALGVSPTLFD